MVQKYSEEVSGKIEEQEIIDKLFSADGTVQDLVSNLEKSETEFAKKTLKTLSHMSPLSLAVVFEQIKRGQSMNLKDVFEMEYRVSQSFMNHTEFYEGVRALLIDKDKSPKWKHKTVNDVSKEEIHEIFNRDARLELDILKI